MKKLLYILLIAITPMFFSSCDELFDNVELSEEEIVNGLKTALELGTDSSVIELNKEDGYFKNEIIKILLPPEADPLLEILASAPAYLGLNEKVDEVILRLNRTAEDAVTEAKPIFINAITEMTVEDGLNILNGVSSNKAEFDSTAATSYLMAKTYVSLFSLYQPKIKTALDNFIELVLKRKK